MTLLVSFLSGGQTTLAKTSACKCLNKQLKPYLKYFINYEMLRCSKKSLILEVLSRTGQNDAARALASVFQEE